ncbi:hypothetical protein N581_09940 [Lactobacillus jensenii MD IIE-70(2)]|nr:hypothetical protein N581_09940 [Lactobacillus jensenii MD IIE-70(2)]
MENIIDTSDVTCCSHCKKSLENVNPIYQTDDLLFCSKDCLADFVIENEFESLTAAFIGLELVNVTLPPDIDRCTTCKKRFDMFISNLFRPILRLLLFTKLYSRFLYRNKI